jgi:ABC-2 type transport system permease protein
MSEPGAKTGSGRPANPRPRRLTNVLALAWREAGLMRHDPTFVGVVLAQPVMMLLLLGLALSNEPANVPLAVLDRSGTSASRRLVEEMTATGYFLAPRPVAGYEEGRDLLARGKAVAFLVIPDDFARDAVGGVGRVQVLLDGADPLSAARVGGILRSVAARFDATGREVRPRRQDSPRPSRGGIELRNRFWFNATLADRNFFLATLAGMLLTNLCLSVTSLGLVAERESGTFEQTLSLPTRPMEIVLGKLLPYVGVSYVVLAIAIFGSGILFGIWPAGSWLALAVLTLPFVLASLAIGVLVSALARTSAQAVFITVFFILPSMILSGVLLPYQLMPDGARELGAILPLRWYQIGLRRIVSRGGGFEEIWVPFLALCALFAGLLMLIRWRLKPRLG